MLIIAASLLIAVGAMHSFLGGKRLINPILESEDLPIILGSRENSQMTLWAGWHLLTLFWWGLAAILLVIAFFPERTIQAVLIMMAACTAFSGLLALVLSRGKHRSWIIFLPLSICCAVAASDWSG